MRRLRDTTALRALRDSSGYLRDRADDPDILFPSYPRWLSSTGITLDELLRCQDRSGNLKSCIVGSNTPLTATASPTPDYFVDGYRGTYIDTDGDYYSADVFDPALASKWYGVVFSPRTHVAGTRPMFGRYAAERWLYARIDANDQIDVYVFDGTRTNATGKLAACTTGASAGVYLLQVLVNRATGLVETRLSKQGAGLQGAEKTLDISAYTTFAGGTTPKFYVGGIPGVLFGGGIWYGGIAVASGAQVEASGFKAAAAAALGFE